MATIWGRAPDGLPKCYALNIPISDADKMIEEAKERGWSSLVLDRQPQPTLFGAIEPSESASSENEPSPKPKRRYSRKSDAASRA